MARIARRLQQSIHPASVVVGPNLLVGKVFTSDVADSTTEPGNPITHATDQNTNTRWISQPQSPANITADLGGVYDLSRIVIVFAGNTIRNYTVSVSTDGSNYTQISSGTTDNTTPQTITITSFSVAPKGRYLRITSVDRWNTGFGNSIWEIEAYGSLDSSYPVGTIANLTSTVASNTQINLAWTYSGSALSGYTLRRNGTVIASPVAGATNYNDSGLTAGTTYNYTLVGNFTAGGTTNTASTSKKTTGGGIPKVMPLGDSITDGLAYAGAYRRYLWQRLVTQEGYSLDFVGSLSNGTADLGDKNHEGHSGWRIRDLRAQIDGWMNTYQPDVVLLLIGSNDAEQNDDMPGAPARLQDLIQRMHTLRPNLVTIVSTATPEAGEPVDIPEFNSHMPAVVNSLRASGHTVILVDGFSALTLSDLDDGIHPNWTGHQKLANVFYPQLKAFLDGELT